MRPAPRPCDPPGPACGAGAPVVLQQGLERRRRAGVSGGFEGPHPGTEAGTVLCHLGPPPLRPLDLPPCLPPGWSPPSQCPLWLWVRAHLFSLLWRCPARQVLAPSRGPLAAKLGVAAARRRGAPPRTLALPACLPASRRLLGALPAAYRPRVDEVYQQKRGLGSCSPAHSSPGGGGRRRGAARAASWLCSRHAPPGSFSCRRRCCEEAGESSEELPLEAWVGTIPWAPSVLAGLFLNCAPKRMTIDDGLGHG